MTTLNLTVGAGTDDGFFSSSSGTYDRTSPSSSVGGTSYDGIYNAWERFTGVSGLSGSTINSAALAWYVVNSFGNPATIHIYADDQVAPGYVTSQSDGVGRTLTTASVSWSGFTTSATNTSPDISSVIQELANSYDPSAIQLLIEGQGTTNNYLSLGAYEGSHYSTLDITYTAGGGGVTVTPGIATLVTAGQAPTVTTTANQTVTPSIVALVTSGKAPAVTATANQFVMPSIAALVTSGKAPTVTVSDNKNVTPSVTLLGLTGYAPTISVAAAPSPLLTGIVAYWPFDEGTGTSAADATGNGHTATLIGTAGWGTAKLGASAASYPGATGAGTTFTAITSTTTFTYAAWIKPDSGASSGLYQNLMTAPAGGIWMYQDKLTYYYGPGNHFSSTTITRDAWHHVAVVNDGGNMTFYLDGSADGTATSAPSYDFEVMGADPIYGSEPFYGSHDEVGLWDRVLTSTEIAALYNGGTGLAYPFTETSIVVSIAVDSDDVVDAVGTGISNDATALGGAGQWAVGILGAAVIDAGLRFPALSVGQGATIDAATLTVNVQATGGAFASTIYGVDEDTCAAWATTNPHVATQTTASVSTVPSGTGTFNVDVTSIVQEIVNRPGWASGNALGFVLINTAGTGYNYYIAEDSSAGTGHAASLVIDFTGGVTPSGVTITPSIASLGLTGLAPTIGVSDNKSVTPSTLALVTSLKAVTVTVDPVAGGGTIAGRRALLGVGR